MFRVYWEKLNPKPQIDVTEEKDFLRVNLSRDLRLQSLLIGLAVGAILTIVLLGQWKQLRIEMRISLGILLLVDLIQVAAGQKMSTAELTVRPSRISFHYSLNGQSARDMLVPDDVGELRYSPGGKHNPSGLYADRSWRVGKCILPMVSEDEAYRVRGLILDRFPEFNNGKGVPNLLTELNLSGR